MINEQKLYKLIAVISLFLFVLSLCLPALGAYKGITVFVGGLLLLTFYAGASGFIIGLFWVSNVFYFLSLMYCFKAKFKKALNLSIVAFIISISFFVLSFFKLLFSKHATEAVSRFKIGFWCWLLSIFVVVLFSAIEQYSVKKRNVLN